MYTQLDQYMHPGTPGVYLFHIFTVNLKIDSKCENDEKSHT